MIRIDHTDVVYRTVKEKYKAVVNEIAELYEKKQPVLVGTISINNSEILSKLLNARGIPHQVLNAKQHEKEAQIVAQAGQPGMVTISTNMAGRGTDIVLGPGVPELGGLFILGTERHESRRIDNQLRGRSGRQGDQGESRFYLSLEDDLLRIFGSDRFSGLLERVGMTEDMPLESSIVARGIESAQKQVESRNFDIRKHLLEYDDVMNRQREVIYRQRRHILTNVNTFDDVQNLLDEESQVFINKHFTDRGQDTELNWPEFKNECRALFGFIPVQDEIMSLEGEGRMDYILDRAKEYLDKKVAVIGEERFKSVVNWILLSSLDAQWKDHLLNMDRLKEGIGLRGYAQKDPLREYQREGFEMFEEMVARIRTDSVLKITGFWFADKVQDDQGEEVEGWSMAPPPMPARKSSNFVYTHGSDSSEERVSRTERRSSPKIGRNDPCPCGSGKKYKHCHGAH
jgi:preprotein translocase subunit SecA